MKKTSLSASVIQHVPLPATQALVESQTARDSIHDSIIETLQPATFDLGADRRRRRVERSLALAVPVVALLLWELVAQAGVIDRPFFPAPSDTVGTFLRLVQSGELVEHLAASFRRVALGYTLGAIPAILLGIGMGLFWHVRVVISPLMGFTYPIPKIALLPILLLIFGPGDTSIYVLVSIAVFYPVLINTLTGVLSIERIYLDVGHVFRARGLSFLRTVAIPGALPTIFASLRLAWGIAFIVVIASEFNSANEGLGTLIFRSWQLFSVECMYVGIMITGLIGLLSYIVFDELERFIIPWNAERKQR